MSEISEILAVVLSQERSPQDKVASLDQLRDHLQEEEVLFQILAALNTERSAQVRAAALALVVGVDATRIRDRGRYFGGLKKLFVKENEAAVRILLIQCFADWVKAVPELEEDLCEALLFELDEEIQVIALSGIRSLVLKSQITLQALHEYQKQAPDTLRRDLLQTFLSVGAEASYRACLSFLSPSESVDVRRAALAGVAKAAVLPAEVLEGLQSRLLREPEAPLREAMVQVLLRHGDIGRLGPLLLGLIETFPEHAPLLMEYLHHLDSDQGGSEKLEAMFLAAESASLKATLLAALEKIEDVTVFISALSESNFWVRRLAIAGCASRIEGRREQVGVALIQAFGREPTLYLKAAILQSLSSHPGFPKGGSELLLKELSENSDPRLYALISALVGRVELDDSNRKSVLVICLNLLRDPALDSELLFQLSERVQSFNFLKEPGLLDCLRQVILRTDDYGQMGTLWERMKAMAPDLGPLRATLLELVFRHVHRSQMALRMMAVQVRANAREPLIEWINCLLTLGPRFPEVAAHIPYLSAMVGLDVQGESAVLSLLREKRWGEAHRAVDSGWKSHSLKKSDLIRLLDLGLNTPDQEGLLQKVFRIAEEGKLLSAEIVEQCLVALTKMQPHPSYRECFHFLKQNGPLEPSYPQALAARFNQETFSIFCRLSADAHEDDNPSSEKNSWEIKTTLTYPGWPISELFFLLEPRPNLAVWLKGGIPRTLPSRQTLQYLILFHLGDTLLNAPFSNPNRAPLSEEEMRSLGGLITSVRGDVQRVPLLARAVVTFKKEWKGYAKGHREIAADVLAAAKEIYLDYLLLLKRLPQERNESARPFFE